LAATLSQRGRSSINDVPEYLAPGVYVEEVSYRSKSIAGVSTSTNGFALAIRSGLDVVAEWVGLLLVGFLLGAAGSTAVGWALHRRRQCRGTRRGSSTSLVPNASLLLSRAREALHPHR
jgi:hypothetical protein